jgi:NAD-dependent dihydropyrimidine dehydrogenase PreA subunit
MNNRIHVVVSQGRSRNPAKRALEDKIVTGLLGKDGIEVIVVPHLYDLSHDGAAMSCLKRLSGEIILFGWLYPRAMHWILSRNGVLGKEGTSLLEGDGDIPAEEELAEPAPHVERVIEQMEIPDRRIYCLDLRVREDASAYIDEALRIANESTTEVAPLQHLASRDPSQEATAQPRLASPADEGGNGRSAVAADRSPVPRAVEETVARRWYPVIDYSRCTNCLECVEFCLFGVYGIDQRDAIVVEQPDNCRKGCPACSRICPEGAILFPQHKTPAIAGGGEGTGGIKIDLSALFSAPSAEAADLAARERDEHLQQATQESPGTQPGCTCKRDDKPAPKDGLDKLVDELDGLEL